MIVRSQAVKTHRLLIECKGSIVPAIARKILLGFILGVFAALLRLEYFGPAANDATKIDLGPFTALGVAISLFLGFHNNASYGRWWEARTYWGTQIIYIRNLARFVISYCEGSEGEDWKYNRSVISCEEGKSKASIQGQASLPTFNDEISDWRVKLVLLSIAQTHALRAQLRPYSKSDGEQQAIHDRNRFLTPSLLESISSSKNPANAILIEMGKILGKAYKNPENGLDSYTMIQVSRHIDNICEIQTACERIHNTSLPLAYSLLVTRTSFMYVLLVPFAMAEKMGWWTPIFTAIVAYTFFGLDKLAREIQQPFSDKPQCLALSAMCRTCEIDSLEILGITTLHYLKPIRDVLM